MQWRQFFWRIERKATWMPYINALARARVAAGGPEEAGELNYALTRLCLDYLGRFPQYVDFNEVIGALECTKLELYRRAVAPYETKKAANNGDLFYDHFHH